MEMVYETLGVSLPEILAAQVRRDDRQEPDSGEDENCRRTHEDYRSIAVGGKLRFRGTVPPRQSGKSSTHEGTTGTCKASFLGVSFLYRLHIIVCPGPRRRRVLRETKPRVGRLRPRRKGCARWIRRAYAKGRVGQSNDRRAAADGAPSCCWLRGDGK
jgi:hypothetical protein